MHKMLEEIIRFKIQDLRSNPSTHFVRSGRKFSLSKAEGRVEGFRKDKFIRALKNKAYTAIIAEVKFASPSAGVIGLEKDLIKKITAYQKAQVNAISIITEPHFFKGDPHLVQTVKKEVQIPVLQKDFVIDELQIYEAARLGSDALLLIVRIIPLKKLQKFVELCLRLGIEPVVEVNSEEDLKKALKTATRIIAVNARDLDTFAVDVDRACRLLEKIPAQYCRLGFSGVLGKKEFQQYVKAGASGVLIGTALMRKEDPDEFISSLKTQ